MSTTQETLNKLNDKQRHTLETYSAVMHDSKARGNTAYAEEYFHKIWGYVECLADTGVIGSQFEQRVLVGWFNEDHRK